MSMEGGMTQLEETRLGIRGKGSSDAFYSGTCLIDFSDLARLSCLSYLFSFGRKLHVVKPPKSGPRILFHP